MLPDRRSLTLHLASRAHLVEEPSRFFEDLMVFSSIESDNSQDSPVSGLITFNTVHPHPRPRHNVVRLVEEPKALHLSLLF
jgi:hypothetical protein